MPTARICWCVVVLTEQRVSGATVIARVGVEGVIARTSSVDHRGSVRKVRGLQWMGGRSCYFWVRPRGETLPNTRRRRRLSRTPATAFRFSHASDARSRDVASRLLSFCCLPSDSGYFAAAKIPRSAATSSSSPYAGCCSLPTLAAAAPGRLNCGEAVKRTPAPHRR